MAKCSNRRPRWWATVLTVCLGLLLVSGPAQAATVGEAVLDTAQPLPEAIRQRIARQLTDTLAALFGEDGTLTLDTVRQHPLGVASQVQSGVNLELEDLGYRLTTLELRVEAERLESSGTLDLVGGGVTAVDCRLDAGDLPDFWRQRHEATLAMVRERVSEALAPTLIGLPLGARDPNWARRQVEASWIAPPELADAFPDHDITLMVSLDVTAEIGVALTPREPLVNSFRVEARSDSLLMLTLDPIEEVILGHSDLVIGQPVSQVLAHKDDLETELLAAIRQSEPARTFAVTNPGLALEFPDDRKTEVRAIARVESSQIHLRVEAFVDLNNDDRPAEFEGLVGWRWGLVEPFVVLNVLTEDVEVRTDVGLALYDGAWFAGGAWDIDEGAPKAFASWSPIPQMRLSAEVYRAEDDGQTQVGVLYQPTQQLGVGAFTDTAGVWWIRTSFRL